MNLSQNGLNFIKSFEGCRLTAYQDIVGVWTIGYGHIRGVKSGQIITQQVAEDLLMEDCSRYIANVNSYQSKYNWNQNQFDALVSFAFNIGSINQLTANGTRNNDIIARKMLEYCKADGKKVNGLLIRRQKEQGLFLKKTEPQTDIMETPNNPYIEPISNLRKRSKGESVKWLQFELNEAGYRLTIDGIFGNETDLAVKQFQELYNLAIDGIVGTKTREMLKIK